MRIAPQRRPIADRRASRVGRLALPAVLLMLLSLAPAAAADKGTTIIERCTHGKSLSGFSQKDYRRALQELPTEVEEYSPCGNLIRRAQLAAAGGGGGSNGKGGGSSSPVTPVSPEEQNAIKNLSRTAPPPQRIGGQLVNPGVLHTNLSSAISSLPDALLAVLAFILACAAALGGRSIRNGIRAHRAG
jgi:hypothetical protein